MNEQAFTNALRAMRGDRRDYPEYKEPDPVKVAIDELDSFVLTLQATGFMPQDEQTEPKSAWLKRTPTELQARIEMRVQELRELITTGEIS